MVLNVPTDEDPLSFREAELGLDRRMEA